MYSVQEKSFWIEKYKQSVAIGIGLWIMEAFLHHDVFVFRPSSAPQMNSLKNSTQESNCVLPHQLHIRLQADGDVIIDDKVSFGHELRVFLTKILFHQRNGNNIYQLIIICLNHYYLRTLI